ncbi:MAG: hypothetical protein JSV64_06605 [Candidatus Bathyarchaeota archaeon]|jgi:hypothetical protein|nr:MAG: hypothetical protein JSV64_06605 [Candidatus Bathyarchaeota archaeon]
MSFPQALTVRYFQLVNNRRFTEAQRELQRIKGKIEMNDWNKGYYRALQGMLLARKHNGNQYTLLHNLDKEDRETLAYHREEFLKYVRGRFAKDFDRGYFSAWNDYIRLLLKSCEETDSEIHPQEPGAQTSITKYTETSQLPA